MDRNKGVWVVIISKDRNKGVWVVIISMDRNKGVGSLSYRWIEIKVFASYHIDG